MSVTNRKTNVKPLVLFVAAFELQFLSFWVDRFVISIVVVIITFSIFNILIFTCTAVIC